MNSTSTRKANLVLVTGLFALVALAAAPLTASAQVSAQAPACDCRLQSYDYTFDKTIDPWSGAIYSAGQVITFAGKQRPILSVAGNGKESYALLNSYGADAVWMQAAYKATAGNLHLSYDVSGIENAGRLAPVIYVGRNAPQSLDRFQKLGYSLDKGKQTLIYNLDLAAAGLEGQEFVIAIGYMNLDVAQTGQSAMVDNIHIFLHDGD